MSDSEDNTCPLCMEEMDLVDKNFVPCPCGYRVCMWCWHHIRENMNGLCPACRVPYKEDPHAFVEVDRTEVVKKNKEKKQKERQDKKATDKPAVTKVQSIDRKHLHNYRVVQRNLVYIIGVPSSIATEEILRRPEYFGQYGRIAKVVVHRNHASSHATVSAYVTFTFKDDARASIQSLEGFWLEGHQVRASFGTTKYCNNFIRGVPCNNPECVYLHELGEDEDRFTKEEIQAGYSKLMQQPGKDQILVTGAGGPSGTGKRTSNELVFPPPVFVQDLTVAEKKKQISSSAAMEHRNQFREEAALEEAKAVSSSTSSSSLSALDKSQSKSSAECDLPSNTADEGISSSASTTLEQQQQRIQLNEDRMREEKEKSGLADSKDSSKQAAMAAKPTGTSSGNQHSPDSSFNPKQSGSNTANPDRTNLKSDFSSLVSPSSFNGLGNCAVFPVPISSLSVSVWRNVLQSDSGDDLKINPYAMISIPLTDLFELTMPPVDAACMPSWPKPSSHYSQGIGAGGVSHGPAAQHIYHSTASESTQGTQQPGKQHSQADMTPEQLQYHQQKAYLQQQQQQQQQQQRANQQFRDSQQQQQQQQQQYAQHQFAHQQQGQQQPNMAALQQIFPGVNMSFGAQGSNNPTNQQVKR